MFIPPSSKSVAVLLGPTASGKSALAMRYVKEAQTTGYTVEIVVLDSAQVYRDMDIGSAKPSRAERAIVRHHLIDICMPTEVYNVRRFANDCQNAISAIKERGHIPLLVGGTMMYFNVLLQGLSSLPVANPEIRARINQDAKHNGWSSLHSRLARVDAITAKRIKPQDSQRIERALELWYLTKTPPFQLYQGARESALFSFNTVALLPQSRPWLHERIAKRLDVMWQQGFVEEVKMLRSHYRLHVNLPAIRSIGYRQVWEFLEGKSSEAEMRNKALFATRQLAKRQITWLRSLPVSTYIDPQNNSVWEHLVKALQSDPRA